jgi:hypothetical protein
MTGGAGSGSGCARDGRGYQRDTPLACDVGLQSLRTSHPREQRSCSTGTDRRSRNDAAGTAIALGDDPG